MEQTHPLMQRNNSPWIEYLTASKHPYYYNTITGVTQWERPIEMDNMNTPAPPNMPVRTPNIATPTNTSYGPRGSNLFIFHIPSEWNDIDLIQHFQRFGTVRSARIQRDGAGRNRGFGFISFDNVPSARNAIRGMNGFNVSGKYLKVKVKKGEEDANDEGLDAATSQLFGNVYNKAMPNIPPPFPYNNPPLPTGLHMHPGPMYAPHTAPVRNHIPHYSPY